MKWKGQGAAQEMPMNNKIARHPMAGRRHVMTGSPTGGRNVGPLPAGSTMFHRRTP